MGIPTKDVDIKIVFYKYYEKYYPGDLYFNDVNIFITELNDIIRFATELLENNNTYERIIENADYKIEISVKENDFIIEVDRSGGIEDPVKIFELFDIKEKDKDFYRDFIKVKAIELANGLYGTKYIDGLSIRTIKINNKKINMIRDPSILFFHPI